MAGLALLFDLDGTLVDSLPGIEYSCERALQVVTPGRALPALRDHLGPPIRKILAQVLHDIPAESLDDVERYFRVSYDSEGWKKSIAYPGVSRTLRRLSEHGYRCFVVTNKPLGPSRMILNHLGLRSYFEEVVSPDSTEPPFGSKAEAVSYLIGKYSLQAKHTLFVGDSTDDASAAERCGVAFVAAAYGYGHVHLSAQVAPTYTIPTFELLLSVVGCLERAPDDGGETAVVPVG